MKKLTVFICVLLLSSCGASATPSTPPEPGVNILTQTPPVSPDSGDKNNIPAQASFSLSSASHTLPADVLEEVLFWGGGGDPFGCGPRRQTPDIRLRADYSELMDQVFIISCNWRENDVVTVIVEFPDGTNISEQIQASADQNEPGQYGVWYSFTPQLSDPIGEYVFRLQGPNYSLAASHLVSHPDGPRMHEIEGKLLLHGFESHEAVRLLAYSLFPEGKLKGWQQFRTDTSGQLVIDLDCRNCNYIVIGERSGEVHSHTLAATKEGRALKQTQSNPEVGEFYACASPCQSNGANATRSFPEGTTRIYAQWDFENIPSGSRYVRKWTMNGREWVKYDCTWQGPESGTDTVTLKEPGGLYAGTWEVSISVDGNVLLREQVVVEGNSTYWSPAGTFYTCYGK